MSLDHMGTVLRGFLLVWGGVGCFVSGMYSLELLILLSFSRRTGAQALFVSGGWWGGILLLYRVGEYVGIPYISPPNLPEWVASLLLSVGYFWGGLGAACVGITYLEKIPRTQIRGPLVAFGALGGSAILYRHLFSEVLPFFRYTHTTGEALLVAAFGVLLTILSTAWYGEKFLGAKQAHRDT